ncbi:MAG: hypothetical protein K2L48_01000 [Mycoplasmoidaceae bacterium]|nr:hypothetical protein [Mycoplasmoidaceae bacterium]
MKKEYKYSNLKQETNTSGKVMLEPSKKTKKRKQGVKPPRTSFRDVVIDTRNLLLNFMNKQEEFNKQVLNRLDNMDQRLSNVEGILKRNNLK